MASVRDTRKKPSVAQVVFGKLYVPQIADFIYKKYGASFACYAEDRNTWRDSVAHTAAIETDILLETRMFIRCELDRYPDLASVRQNPQFLHSLVTCIADYLSKYFARNGAFKKRKDAKQYLMSQLWMYFPHIQNMLREQEAKRAAREMRNQRRKIAANAKDSKKK